MLKVTKENSGNCKFLHEVIFCESYKPHELERVLSAFGYHSLEEFILDCKKPVEECDKVFHLVDWDTLSMFICDTHEDGILMRIEEAIEETKRVTGIDVYLE